MEETKLWNILMLKTECDTAANFEQNLWYYSETINGK